MEKPEELKDQQEQRQKPKSNKKDADQTKKKVSLILIIVLLMALSAGIVYFWKDSKAKDITKKKDAEISSLQKTKDDLQKQLDEKNKTTENKTTPVVCTPKAPSADTLTNIRESITSRNTAALEGYMAPTVKVVIAASGGVGDRTPTQAVSDITSYISSSTDPWNFALAKTVTDNYAKGNYAQYFPSIAVIGKSANGIVISFSFDCNGKINTVFMAIKDSLLDNLDA